jgi:Amt family ammonium transporter
VHGAGGTLGAVLTGIFATRLINPALGRDAAGHPLPTGGFDGHWSQIFNQLAGIGLAWGISIVGTLALLVLVDKTMGLRVSSEDEHVGLDLTQHNEEGYDLNS